MLASEDRILAKQEPQLLEKLDHPNIVKYKALLLINLNFDLLLD